MEEIRYNTNSYCLVVRILLFLDDRSFECQIGYSPGTTFLFSLPISAAPNTYLMHHTCARYSYTCLYVASIVHFRHTNCKIGGESYRATPAIFKCNRVVLNLFHSNQTAKQLYIRQSYHLLIALSRQLRSSNILSSDWNWQLFNTWHTAIMDEAW